MNNFISTRHFRKYVSLFSKLLNLPDSVKLIHDGKLREFTVFHRFELLNFISKDGGLVTGRASLSVMSYPIFTAAEITTEPAVSDAAFTRIVPEFAFNAESIFWAGAPQRVFKDHQVVSDKRFGAFAWCYAYERELNFDEFYVNYDLVLNQMTVFLDVLEKLEVPEEKRVFAGSVDDEAGLFRDPTGKTTPLVTERPQVSFGAGRIGMSSKVEGVETMQKDAVKQEKVSPGKDEMQIHFADEMPADTIQRTSPIERVARWFSAQPLVATPTLN